MTRVALDARLLHYNRTGIGRYVRHLYAAMAEVAPGRDVVIAYSRRDRERRLRSAWRREATLWTPAHHPLERWTLALELARLRPNVVHSPDHVCPRPMTWKAVLTVHDLAFWRVPESHTPDSRSYYSQLRRSAAQAARIICVSHATRADLRAACPGVEDRVRVVHEAPDPQFTTIDSARSTLANERPYFVFVGTISPRKNVSRIIRALASIATDTRDRQILPELIVVGGDGYGADEVRKLPMHLGIAEDVRFVGPQPASEVARLYRHATALVYPSLLEGFGLPVVEAMAAGAPVITANRSSMPEVAGDAALLVDPEDESAIANAMRRTVQEAALRADLRERGRIRAASFSWERCARETLAVFDEALAA